jgi:hypothetical protein
LLSRSVMPTARSSKHSVRKVSMVMGLMLGSDEISNIQMMGERQQP